MPLLKALQKLPVPDSHEDYTVALLRFKQESSLHSNTMRSLEGKYDPVSRLARADATERYSQACKVYFAARKLHANEKALILLQNRAGADNVQPKQLEAVDIAKLAGIDVHVGMRQMISDARMKAARESMNDEEFRKLCEDTKALLDNKNLSVKEQFKESSYSDKDDPTLGDFEPL